MKKQIFTTTKYTRYMVHANYFGRRAQLQTIVLAKNYHQTHSSGCEHVMGHGLILFIVSQ